MKTPTELKFERIIKEGFHEVLKPLGFKKKGNNFYLPQADLGKLINVQKSTSSSKNNIRFTINACIFVPEFWLAYFDFQKKGILPDFPSDMDCFTSKRISELKGQGDIWYTITDTENENIFISIMHDNLRDFILPHFNLLNSKEQLIELLDSKDFRSTFPLGKLIIYGENKMMEEAKNEYELLLLNSTRNPFFMETIRSYGKEYGIIS